MKTCLATSGAVLMLSVGAAPAATWGVNAYGDALPTSSISQQYGSAPIRDRVYDGTGYYGAGTATGGPVGGLSNQH